MDFKKFTLLFLSVLSFFVLSASCARYLPTKRNVGSFGNVPASEMAPANDYEEDNVPRRFLGTRDWIPYNYQMQTDEDAFYPTTEAMRFQPSMREIVGIPLLRRIGAGLA